MTVNRRRRLIGTMVESIRIQFFEYLLCYNFLTLIIYFVILSTKIYKTSYSGHNGARDQ